MNKLHDPGTGLPEDDLDLNDEESIEEYELEVDDQNHETFIDDDGNTYRGF